ncbi:hypothetical protein PR048_025151 [Dryococelus australis]|uniref:Uncharacterized protein n=1 Tax=Dryococelus australis TaxID=614101 RepID=A0ABQ9GQL8_9NEOP|nr:hypothetical protein PR048_025151 [Dryococelus australis]
MERIPREQLLNVWFRSDKKTRQEQVCDYVIRWLQGEFKLPNDLSIVSSAKTRNQAPGPRPGPSSPQLTGIGRPKMLYEKCNTKSKRRKIHHLLQSRSPKEVSFTADVNLRAAGKRDAAEIAKELSTASPRRATRIKKTRVSAIKPTPYTDEEALALFSDAQLTTHQSKLTKKETVISIHHIM